MLGPRGRSRARDPLYDQCRGRHRRRPDLSGRRGARIATPIDTVKPKETAELGRRANLERDPGGTLLCENWDPDDWSRLWWVRARLVLLSVPDVDEYEAALRAKYMQYRTVDFAAVLVFDVLDVVGWSAAD